MNKSPLSYIVKKYDFTAITNFINHERNKTGAVQLEKTSVCYNRLLMRWRLSQVVGEDAKRFALLFYFVSCF